MYGEKGRGRGKKNIFLEKYGPIHDTIHVHVVTAYETVTFALRLSTIMNVLFSPPKPRPELCRDHTHLSIIHEMKLRSADITYFRDILLDPAHFK